MKIVGPAGCDERRGETDMCTRLSSAADGSVHAGKPHLLRSVRVTGRSTHPHIQLVDILPKRRREVFAPLVDDPREGRMLAVALAPSELVGVAENRCSRFLCRINTAVGSQSHSPEQDY